jgi:hypothetical protein
VAVALQARFPWPTATWLEDILTGDAEAWDVGEFARCFPGEAHHRSTSYVTGENEPSVFGIGVFGQNLLIEPADEIVVVKLSPKAVAWTKGASP